MKWQRKKWSLLILIFIIILSFIIVFSYINTASGGNKENAAILWQSVIMGVLCSIIASGLFYLMQSAVDADNNENVLSKLSEIDNRLVQQKDLYGSGVVSIRQKTYYDKNGEFWKTMIRSTSDQLDLIGRDISPWFNHEYRTAFIDKVKNMIKNNKNVRIILSDDNFNEDNVYAVERKTKDEKKLSKVERTCYELRQIFKEMESIKRKQRGNLDVYIADQKLISYMYIRTDRQCFMSPYVSDGDSFLLELETGVEYTQFLDLDFERMLRSPSVKKFELGVHNERAKKSGRRKLLFRK